MVGIMIVKQNYGVMDWDCHCIQLPKQADRPVWVAGIDINTASLFFLVVEGGYVPVVYFHGYVVVLLRIVTCLIFHDIIWSHCVAFHWLGSLCFFFLFWNLISYTCILNHIRIIIKVKDFYLLTWLWLPFLLPCSIHSIFNAWRSFCSLLLLHLFLS